jgi:hypothetical protein
MPSRLSAKRTAALSPNSARQKFHPASDLGIFTIMSEEPQHLQARRSIGVLEPDVKPDVTDNTGDHDRFAHYVRRRELEKAQRSGTAVTALCGKRWKPDQDPSKFPMCPTCAEIAADRIARSFGS